MESVLRDSNAAFGQGSVQVLTEFSLIPLCTVRYSPGLSATPWPLGPVFFNRVHCRCVFMKGTWPPESKAGISKSVLQVPGTICAAVLRNLGRLLRTCCPFSFTTGLLVWL